MQFFIFVISALICMVTANESGKQYGDRQDDSAMTRDDIHISLQPRQASRMYTATFTIFWYEYAPITRIVTISSIAETVTAIGFDFTSTRLRLSTVAASSGEAYELLKPTADSYSSSKSSSEESVSRSLYQMASLRFVSSSMSLSSSRSAARNSPNNAGRVYGAPKMWISDSAALMVSIVVSGIVGGLMLAL